MQTTQTQPQKLSKKAHLLALFAEIAKQQEAAEKAGRQPNLSLGKVKKQYQFVA